MTSEERLHWCGNVSRRDGRSSTTTPAPCRRSHTNSQDECALSDGKSTLQYLQNFFIALEGWNQVRAGEFGARPREHLAGDFEAAIARGGARGFQRFQ